MAVLTVEVFALAGEDAAPLDSAQQYDVWGRLDRALAPLRQQPTPVLRLLRSTVTPYEAGALIQAVCVAESAALATDAIAARLGAAMATTAVFARWEMRAGQTCVAHSDN